VPKRQNSLPNLNPSTSPLVGHKKQHHFKTRSTEVTSFCLRLGKCRINANLYQIGCHETGLCSLCQEPETIQHYIIGCQYNTVARALKTTCVGYCLVKSSTFPLFYRTVHWLKISTNKHIDDC